MRLTFYAVIPILLAASYWIISTNKWPLKQPATAKEELTSCFGNPNAVTKIIYLHGLDTVGGSPQEHKNRQKLKKLALDRDAQIAMPRSHSTCKSQLCWPAFNRSTRKKTWAEVTKQVNSCGFKSDRSIIVGFSNGGYFVNKFYQDCSLSNFHGIAVGAAGRFQPGLDLSNCGKLLVVSGKSEVVKSEARALVAKLVTKSQGNVDYLEHPGGHELPDLRKLLLSYPSKKR